MIIFRPSLANYDRSSISIAGPGLVLLQTFSCFSRSTFHEFPFFFFLLYSSVAPTLKIAGPLDCNSRASSACFGGRRSVSLGGKISVEEFMHFNFAFDLDFERFLYILSCAASFCLGFLLLLSFPFFFFRSFFCSLISLL